MLTGICQLFATIHKALRRKVVVDHATRGSWRWWRKMGGWGGWMLRAPDETVRRWRKWMILDESCTVSEAYGRCLCVCLWSFPLLFWTKLHTTQFGSHASAWDAFIDNQCKTRGSLLIAYEIVLTWPLVDQTRRVSTVRSDMLSPYSRSLMETPYYPIRQGIYVVRSVRKSSKIWAQ